jgi:parallel beta-helix repeat protein
MRILINGLAVFLLLITVSTARAETLHVPGDYSTIQDGIDAAVNGDTVVVADGMYTGAGNRDIDFGGKSIVVMSENGPAFTTIDCAGDSANHYRGFDFHTGEDSNSVVRGFTIINGWADNGGGIYCHNSSPSITDNMIIGNTAAGFSYGYGGGIYLYQSSSSITDNIISGNTARGSGGGIYSWDSASILDGNTITGNTAIYYGGGLYCIYGPSMTVTNSILWGDDAGTGQEIFLDAGASITVTYSDIEGGWEGDGNINENPSFVLLEKDDCRLLWESPCIDAGQPGSFDPDGTTRDMGARFFDQDDYITLYLTPDAKTVEKGGQLGVTYTVINRREHNVPFWILTRAKHPGGLNLTLVGPDRYTLPASQTVQVHIDHDIPLPTPASWYEYWTWIGMPPSSLYDVDHFSFEVVE